MKRTSLISLLLIFAILFSTDFSIIAQTLDSYGSLKRPKNIGNSDFDGFKNQSFDTYYNSCKLETNLKKVEGNIEKYEADKSNIDANALNADIKSLKKIGEATGGLKNDLKTLKGKSESMTKNAKNLKPRTKSIKAVGNTSKSTKALSEAKSKLGGIVDKQANLLKRATSLTSK